MRRIAYAIAIALAACGGEPTPKNPADRAALCESYDRNTCLHSTQCTLVHVEGTKYACRAEAGECELRLDQTDEAACTKRPGCRFEVASCFCACRGYGRTKIEDKSGPKCACVCGGGKPSMCLAADAPGPP